MPGTGSFCSLSVSLMMRFGNGADIFVGGGVSSPLLRLTSLVGDVVYQNAALDVVVVWDDFQV